MPIVLSSKSSNILAREREKEREKERERESAGRLSSAKSSGSKF